VLEGAEVDAIALQNNLPWRATLIVLDVAYRSRPYHTLKVTCNAVPKGRDDGCRWPSKKGRSAVL
jgi:hypothetical protein